MNLIDKLLNTDAAKADNLKQKVLYSRNLADLLGEKEHVAITIQELPPRRLNDFAGMMLNEDGNFDIDKAFDAKALATAEALIEPDLKDEKLMAHFHCATSKDLAIKLFKQEIGKISDAVSELSGDIKNIDNEIKN